MVQPVPLVGNFEEGLVFNLTLLEMADEAMLKKLHVTPKRRDELVNDTYFCLDRVKMNRLGVITTEDDLREGYAKIGYSSLYDHVDRLAAIRDCAYSMAFINGASDHTKPWTTLGLNSLNYDMRKNCLAYQANVLRMIIPSPMHTLPRECKDDYIEETKEVLKLMMDNFSPLGTLKNRYLRGHPDMREINLMHAKWNYDELASGSKTWLGDQRVCEIAARKDEYIKTKRFNIRDYGC